MSSDRLGFEPSPLIGVSDLGPQPAGTVLASDGGAPYFRKVLPSDLQPGTDPLSSLYWDGSAWVEHRAGERVQLATLSDTYYNVGAWFADQFIGVDSANKTYSTANWDYVASYSPEADAEKLYRWSVKFSEPLTVDANISVWRRPYSGSEVDTGIVIAATIGNTLAVNLSDVLTLYTGDEIKFVTDADIIMRHISIYAHRLDVS